MSMNWSELESRAELVTCPDCRGTYLHQAAVEVWQRTGGERRPGDTVHVDNDGVSSRRTEDGFIDERDDVRVFFWCEMCDSKPVLLIWQHEGQTFRAWTSDQRRTARALDQVRIEHAEQR
jgi:hypothetical protein